MRLITSLKQKLSRRNGRFAFKVVVGIIIVVALAGYVLYQSHQLRAGPEIAVSFPEAGMTLEQSFIHLQGDVSDTAFLYLNGRQIFVTPQGDMNEPLLLYPGFNTITIKAVGKYGRKTIKRVHVYVDASSTPAAEILSKIDGSSSSSTVNTKMDKSYSS